MTGRLITFEVGDGTGKTTQAYLLKEKLEERTPYPVRLTREPGGPPEAEFIRSVLLSPGFHAQKETLGPHAATFLFSAARIYHLDQVIVPALARGYWVISDRFYDSMHVYQALEGISPSVLQKLTTIVTEKLAPHLTFIIDAPVEISAARAQARAKEKRRDSDPFEQETKALYQARRDAFCALAKKDPQRCILINGCQSAQEISEDIWRYVQERLL